MQLSVLNAEQSRLQDIVIFGVHLLCSLFTVRQGLEKKIRNSNVNVNYWGYLGKPESYYPSRYNRNFLWFSFHGFDKD